MPVYTYQCKKSKIGHRMEAFRKMDERHECPPCNICSGETELVLTPTFTQIFEPYKAVTINQETGECPYINNRDEHEAFLRRNGYEEVDNDPSVAPPPMEEVREKQAKERKELAQFSADYNLEDIDVV